MRKRVIVSVLVVVLVYLGSYLAITIVGSYRMGPIGLLGPLGPYRWYPRGFFDKYDRLRPAIAYPYLPLWETDRRFWHKDTGNPPLPPPFVQDDITIVSPVTVIRLRPTDNRSNTITFGVIDANTNRFTVRRVFPPIGADGRYQEYFIATGTEQSKFVAIDDQSTFRFRVLEHITETPVPDTATNEDSPRR